jgi:uncharacterized protein YecE (DUF72 family)
MYHSAYSEEYLQRLHADMDRSIRAGKRVWCVFDNTLSSTYMVQALYLLNTFKRSFSEGES